MNDPDVARATRRSVDDADEPETGVLLRTELVGGPTPQLKVRQFHLDVIDGPGKGTSVASRGEQIVIGSYEGADLSIQDRSVSRFHCRIELADGRLRVTDLKSSNGTMIGTVRINDAYVQDGSVLVLGRTRIRIRIGDRSITMPISAREQFGQLLGGSLPMRRLYTLLEQAAGSDVTVLLQGETGTGKEAAAESIHKESDRRDQPFLVVDCGSLPAALVESELFGHERGAFTGAATQRTGIFEAANGGTVFLDEIGELPADLQPKLLRVVERREVKRVGADRPITVDVRIIAGTHRDLKTAVNEGKFRADLYYRLAVVEATMPSLRDRLEDLPVLVDRFAAACGAAPKLLAKLLAPESIADLAAHAWPGNVRELRNHIERSVALDAPMIPGEELVRAQVVDDERPFVEARDASLASFERRYLTSLLTRHNGNVSAAARAAKLDRAYLYRLLWRYGIK